MAFRSIRNARKFSPDQDLTRFERRGSPISPPPFLFYANQTDNKTKKLDILDFIAKI
jgi:hypothetical protein